MADMAHIFDIKVAVYEKNICYKIQRALFFYFFFFESETDTIQIFLAKDEPHRDLSAVCTLVI